MRINLKDTNVRKGIRSVVQAVIQLGFLALTWQLATAQDTHWLIAVIAVAVVGNQIENGIRSFKIGPDGIEASGDGSQ